MATTRKITYTHTCDLCDTKCPRHELRRFGLVAITGDDLDIVGEITIREPGTQIEGPPVDVCPACRERPISELITLLQTRKAEHQEAREQAEIAHQQAKRVTFRNP
jgi:hypothetical protein